MTLLASKIYHCEALSVIDELRFLKKAPIPLSLRARAVKWILGKRKFEEGDMKKVFFFGNHMLYCQGGLLLV